MEDILSSETPEAVTVPDELPCAASIREPVQMVGGHEDSSDLYPPKRHRFTYSVDLANQIIERYVSGESIANIARDPDMPGANTIYSWAIKHEAFKEKILAAREVRALALEDQASDVVDEVFDKNDVPAARLKFDKAVWQASVNDPNRYGKKTTVSGDASKPVTIVVRTGVPPPYGEPLEDSLPNTIIHEAIASDVEDMDSFEEVDSDG